ncbi:MAG: ABC transporter permease, partial [Actinobacteria bacterium]|nr:ABC transporter permease [Actinomycetota bacterium]
LDSPANLRRRWHPLRVALRLPAGLVGALLTLAVIAVALAADAIAPGDPFRLAGPPLRPPGGAHPMGTDDLGRDLFAGVVHGVRTSLLIVAGVTALSTVVGLVVGFTAGYRWGLVDSALMRLTEFVQVVPRFFLAVVAIALFGPGTERLVVLLGLTSWPLLARVVRAESASLRSTEFVLAAQASGAPTLRIVMRHLLPNALPPLIVVIVLTASQVVLVEAGLAFLGLGDPELVSLGGLAYNAQRFLRIAWWMAAFPGIAIGAVILGLNLLADGLNDALDPRRGGA